ncbi:MAG: MarR family transcriptional regulator [Candidatus Bathyarchaeia archaeon]|jgi:MarR family transcriptional regulator for hemolysin
MILASDEAARELLEVVPVIMKDIRSEMRSRRSPDLSVPQFRTLAFVDRNEGASLSAVANHMGLTLPSTSRLVDGLIARGMLTREDNPADRRRVKLGVTNHGLMILETSRRGTLTYLADKIASLSAEDREVIAKAMKAMRSVFINGTQTQAVVK